MGPVGWWSVAEKSSVRVSVSYSRMRVPGCPGERGCSPVFIIAGQSPWGPLQYAAPLSVGELASLKIQKVRHANSIPKWALKY